MFTYCPKCAGALKIISEDLQTCTQCGFHLYNNPKATNALIIENEKGKILLAKRAIEPQIGQWDLPGGFINAGETLEESMQREAKEELGVNVTNLQYFASYTDTYLYQEVVFPTLVFILTGKVNTAQLTAKDDISQIKFFDKNKIPFEDVAFESVTQALKDYLRYNP